MVTERSSGVSLRGVTQFAVPRRAIEATAEALADAGQDGYELFVLWTGSIERETFVIRNVHVPKQTSYKTREGLVVRVEGSELHRLNVWLYEHRQTLGAQVHAHPTDAFHSTTDDAYPIATEEGALSVVVPDFCRGGVITRGTAYFRLHRGRWRPAPPSLVTVT